MASQFNNSNEDLEQVGVIAASPSPHADDLEDFGTVGNTPTTEEDHALARISAINRLKGNPLDTEANQVIAVQKRLFGDGSIAKLNIPTPAKDNTIVPLSPEVSDAVSENIQVQAKSKDLGEYLSKADSLVKATELRAAQELYNNYLQDPVAHPLTGPELYRLNKVLQDGRSWEQRFSDEAGKITLNGIKSAATKTWSDIRESFNKEKDSYADNPMTATKNVGVGLIAGGLRLAPAVTDLASQGVQATLGAGIGKVSPETEQKLDAVLNTGAGVVQAGFGDAATRLEKLTGAEGKFTTGVGENIAPLFAGSGIGKLGTAIEDVAKSAPRVIEKTKAGIYGAAAKASPSAARVAGAVGKAGIGYGVGETVGHGTIGAIIGLLARRGTHSVSDAVGEIAKTKFEQLAADAATAARAKAGQSGVEAIRDVALTGVKDAEATAAEYAAKLTPEETANLAKLKPSGQPMYTADSPGISKEAKEVLTQRQIAQDLKDKAEMLRGKIRSERMREWLLSKTVEVPLRAAEGATIIGGLAAAGAPVNQGGEAVEHALPIGAAFGLAGSAVSLPGGLRENQLATNRAYLHDFARTNLTANAVEAIDSLPESSKNRILSQVGESMANGTRVSILNSEEVASRLDKDNPLPPDRYGELPNGWHKDGEIVLNADQLKKTVGTTTEGAEGHEAFHPYFEEAKKDVIKRKFDEITKRFSDPKSMQEGIAASIFKRNYAKAMESQDPEALNKLTPELLAEEAQAEMARLLSLHMPAEYFYGGKGIAAHLSDWINRAANFISPGRTEQVPGFDAPFTASDMQAIKDARYQQGKSVKSVLEGKGPLPEYPQEPAAPPPAPEKGASETVAEPKTGRATGASGAPKAPLVAPDGAIQALVSHGAKVKDARIKVQAAMEELGPDATEEAIVKNALGRMVPKEDKLMPSLRDALVSPAVKTDEGMIIKGGSHFEAKKAAKDLGLSGATTGFTTKKGGFKTVADDEALNHAIEIKQVPEDTTTLSDADFAEKRKFMPSVLNIGLETSDGKGVTPEEVISALKKTGVEVTQSAVHKSGTEPTLVATLSRPLSPDEVHKLSTDLRQEAIAQYSDGKGELHGPKAENWRPFNPDYFLTPEGKKLSGPNYGAPKEGTKLWEPTEEEAKSLKDAAVITPSAKWDNMTKEQRQAELEVKQPGNLSNAKLAGKRWYELPENKVHGEGFKFMPSTHPDAIEQAAVKFKDGRIFTAATHGEAELKGRDNGASGKYETGYLTKKKRYLNNEEALAHAIKIKQATIGGLKQASEDLWGGDVQNIDRLEALAFDNSRKYMPTPPEYKEVADKEKLIYNGNMEGKLHLFTDPNTGSTISVKPGEDLASKLVENRAKFAMAPQWVKNEQAPKFMPSTHPDAIKEAAVRDKSGRISTGYIHAQAAISHVGLKAWREGATGLEEGFVTNSREFLNRKDAETRAAEVGQLQHDSQEGLEAKDFSETRRFMPSTNPKAIDKPAIKFPDGKVYTDWWHPGAWAKGTSEYSAEQLGKWHKEFGDDYATRGFTDNQGVFHDAVKAEQIAKDIGQVTEKGLKEASEFYGSRKRALEGGRGLEALNFKRARQFMPSTDPSAISRAAIRRESDGKVFPSETAGSTHWQIPAQYKEELSDYFSIDGYKLYEDGFVDNNGKFHSRESAFSTMKDLGQLPKDFKPEYKDELNVTGLNQAKLMPSTMGLYSQLERTLAAQPEKASPDQLRAALRSTKQAELRETKDQLGTSFEQWLRENPRATKQDMVDFVSENKVQIKEIEKLDDGYMKRMDPEDEDLPSYSHEEQGSLPRFGPDTHPTMSLPGGTDYGETLATLPDKPITYEQWARGRSILPGHEEEMARASFERNPEQRAAFQGSHWDEPNVVLHLRHNIRKLVNKAKMWFMEELQSDWAQKGRKEGYAGTDQLPAGYQLKQELNGKWYVTSEHGNISTGHVTKESAIAAAQKFGGAVPDLPFKGNSWKKLGLKIALRKAIEAGADHLGWTTGEQQAARYDLSKHISEITLEPALTKDGRKYLAAYDLNGKRVIDKTVNDSEIPDLIGKEAAEKLLNAPVKEVSAQIGNPGDTTKMQRIGGLDLKVGGEGMKGFYDKELVNLANDLVKKWGVRVGDQKIQGEKAPEPGYGESLYVGQDGYRGQWGLFDSNGSKVGDIEFKSEQEGLNYISSRREGTVVHSIPITDAMRRDILEKGQPMFMPNVELAPEIPYKYLTPEEQANRRPGTIKAIQDIMDTLPPKEEMAEAALMGKSKRGWYKKSAEAFVHVFGNDSDRFAALVSSLSPQNKNEFVLQNALQTWVAWKKAGEPTEASVIEKLMGENVLKGEKGGSGVLPAWINNTVRALSSTNPSEEKLSGPKVSSFAKNLRGNVNEVTNDKWMANYALVRPVLFAGTGTPIQGKSKGYLAMSARTRETAEYLTNLTGEEWSPSEVQETVWSFAKTLYELRDRQGETRTAPEILDSGELKVANTPDFASLLQDETYRKILKESGYGEALGRLDQSGVGVSDPSQPEAVGEAEPTPRNLGFATAERLENLYNFRRQREGLVSRLADAKVKSEIRPSEKARKELKNAKLELKQFDAKLKGIRTEKFASPEPF